MKKVVSDKRINLKHFFCGWLLLSVDDTSCGSYSKWLAVMQIIILQTIPF